MASSHFPDLPQYNSVAYDRVTGNVDLEALAGCVTRAVRRNDAFGLRFDEHAGVPYQWPEPDTPQIPLVDLRSEPDPGAACMAWMRREFARAFPLRRGRMFDVALLRERGSVTYLYVKAHHLIADGWALHQFITQVFADYEHVLRTGRPLDIDAPSYLDFAREEARYRQSARYDADREFHRAALAGVAPALFPRRAPAGARRTAHHRFVLEGGLIERIRDTGTSPFTSIAATFATYLSRVHRAEEIVLGVPSLNRHTHVEKRTVGHFANTLPLRIATGRGQSMRELAAAVQSAVHAMKRHDRISLGDVLRELPADDAGPRLLFDVTISYMRYPSKAAIPGHARQTAGMAPAHDQDALAVLLTEFEDVSDVIVDLDYACDVFDDDFPIEAAARHIETLLRGGLDRPAEPLSAIPMLTRAERDNLVGATTTSPSEAPIAATVHGLFEEQAARTPDRIAVVAAGTSEPLTYGELDARANQLARALRAEGVGADDRVAVLLERGPHLLVALLGVLKAGGAYVPIDPGYPDERVRFLLEDSGAKVALVDHRPRADPFATTTPVRSIETMLRGSGAPLDPVAGPDNLAYVIYTSGSTGRPKGVQVEHRSVVNRLTWMQKRYPIGDGDVLVQKTPISFDVSVWELFWWAIDGARLALPAAGAEKDPEEMLRVIAARSVTVIHFVPSMFGPFLDLLESSPELLDRCASLRFVFCSGEALPAARVEQFNRIFVAVGGPRLVNLYGPTEATVDVSYFDCPSDPARRVHRVPIGRPIDNIRLYVLDPHDQPQPVGVVGELCIAGIGVARGYLNRPELTRERFLDDPFTPGDRMYRTGDLARWLADGNLEYLGRTDEQVKVRGNRVELGEVRDQLLTFPGVRGAVVVDRASDARGVQLVGYYLAEREIDPSELRAHLASLLPEFMIPAYLVPVEHLPLTPNGKIDRRALPDPVVPASSDDAPRDEVEAELAAIWADVLGVPAVGVHANYFALGGDSILMLKIRARAAEHGIHFGLAEMVQHPTVAALAARATATPAPGAEPAVPPFGLVSAVDRARLAGTDDAYPVTRLQLGLLYHSRAQESSAVYHDVFRYTFDLPWRESAFRRAFDAIVARHPVLRSCFDLAGGAEPLQVVQPGVRGGLKIVDLRAAPTGQVEDRIRAHVDERRFHRYDFGAAPLYLLCVYLTPSTVELVFSFHHAILDGWSVASLVRELLQGYLHGIGADVDPVDTTPLPSSANHVLAERRAVDSEATGRHWRDKLVGVRPVGLDGFRRYQPPGDEQLIVRRVELPTELLQAVRRLARANELPVKSVLFAAHCLNLRLYAGSAEVTTGLVTHGRPEQAGGEQIAGLYLNTLPVRVGPEPRTWLDVVRELYRQERDDHPHRRYPLSAIQSDHGGAVFDTAFNYVHMHVLTPILRLPGVRLLDFQAWEETNFRLLCNAVVDPVDAGIWLRIDGDGSAFTPSQVDLFAQSYVDVLTRMVDSPDEEVDFAFLGGGSGSHGPAANHLDDVVHRFERAAARAPEAIAVVAGSRQWTYERLDRMADRVARRLGSLGAGTGARVGVAMSRSPEMIAAVLGIAKAGGTCVPLDLDYPRQRLVEMVEQARPRHIITNTEDAVRFADPSIVLAFSQITEPGQDPAPDESRRPEISLDGAAYLVFTSGSTGRPNGVVLPHRTLANLVSWQNRVPSGAVRGRTLQFAPLSFDVAFQEIFATLCGGGTLVVVSEVERRDMRALLSLLNRHNVERIFLPYVALQQLAETADALGATPRALRVVISSGEQLRVTEEIRRLCAALPGLILENQYGPSETHVVTSFSMTGDERRFPVLPPIGTAIDGAEVHLLDDRLRPVPLGAKGEIYLGGAGLALGYDGDPDLTRRRFLAHPSGSPGARLYRTGDLGMMLPDGQIAYLGRADSQVKVRGYRVEPGEVEVAIMRLTDAIREVAVVARRREGADATLAAFLVGDRERVDLARLRASLRERLPEHLVPAHFAWLPGMPLTPSGKRNDAALREIPLAATTPAGPTRPRDTYELTLVEILSELLRVPKIGVHDDFFELGGTSLTAMRLVVTIEKRYGVHLPLAALVASPTVAGLAERLRSDRARATFDPLVPIRPAGGERTRPPVFLVHPIGGNVLCYLPLARNLPADLPCYALQAAGGEPGSAPLDTVQELAASYLAAIRRMCPEGPYTIGGWSFGGFVAFEMARQLRRGGDEVAQLILLDTVALAPGPRAGADEDTLLSWFFWELLLPERGNASVAALGPARSTDEETFEFIADAAVRTGVLPPGSSGGYIRRLFNVFRANWRAALAYRPDVVDQDISLIHASEPLPEPLESIHGVAGSMHLDPMNGWGDRTTGRVDVIDVPGDHLQIMTEPYVRAVATEIAALTGGRGEPGRRSLSTRRPAA